MTAAMVFVHGRGQEFKDPAGEQEPFGLDRVLPWGAARDTLTWIARHTRVDQAPTTCEIVGLGHPLRPAWGPPLSDIKVGNGDSPHSIERYLGHPEVAGPIGRENERTG